MTSLESRAARGVAQYAQESLTVLAALLVARDLAELRPQRVDDVDLPCAR